MRKSMVVALVACAVSATACGRSGETSFRHSNDAVPSLTSVPAPYAVTIAGASDGSGGGSLTGGGVLTIECGTGTDECPGSTSVTFQVDSCFIIGDVYGVYGTATFPDGTGLTLGMANEERSGMPGVLGTFAIYGYPSADRVASYDGSGGMSALGSGGRVIFTYEEMAVTSLNSYNWKPVVGKISGTIQVDGCEDSGA